MIRPAVQLSQIIYWLALVLWIGVIITVGVAAMSAFSTLKGDMLPHLEKFAAYSAEEHGRIAAGHILERVFTFADLVQIVAAPLLLLVLALESGWFKVPMRNAPMLVRTACIFIAIGLLVFRVAALSPTMNADLRGYWSAAEAGDVSEAQARRDAFNERHVTATNLYGVTLALLLVTLIVSPAAMSRVNSAPRSRRVDAAPPMLQP